VLQEVTVHELGPVVFPAYAAATVALRKKQPTPAERLRAHRAELKRRGFIA
jgi:phage head maturation protease